MATGPRAYLLEHRPTTQSIRLDGRYINAKQLAADKNLDHGYVCRVLNGDRSPSIDYLKIIADALKMGIEELLDSINDRRRERRIKLDRLASLYSGR